MSYCTEVLGTLQHTQALSQRVPLFPHLGIQTDTHPFWFVLKSGKMCSQFTKENPLETVENRWKPLKTVYTHRNTAPFFNMGHEYMCCARGQSSPYHCILFSSCNWAKNNLSSRPLPSRLCAPASSAFGSVFGFATFSTAKNLQCQQFNKQTKKILQTVSRHKINHTGCNRPKANRLDRAMHTQGHGITPQLGCNPI